MENASFSEERKVFMLTIQSFLHKFRNLFATKDMKRNVKYALISVAYVCIAVIIILRFNIGKFQDDEAAEAMAAQQMIETDDETNNLSEMDYLDHALNRSIELKSLSTKNIILPADTVFTTEEKTVANQLIDNMGQVTIMAADVYVDNVKNEKETAAKKKAAKKKSAAKEKVTDDAKEVMKTTKKIVYSLSKKEIAILQRIVEAEATGEDLKGKILVANVIMNRVNNSAFPDSVEKVVFQRTGNKYQFSPISDRRYYSVKISDETREAVARVIEGEDYSKGALYFSARRRASASNMRWFDTHLKYLFKYGNHEFFTNK